ncbi:uncharacterized protein [Amphiura filiformis]|uniref:uncharacterized protein n=1 Tax=Amphiura filiformis TaxID=82378 RepID=UPI003B226A33
MDAAGTRATQTSTDQQQLSLSAYLQPQSLDQQPVTIQQDFTTLPLNISGALTMTTLSSLNPQIKITEVGQMGSLSTKRLSVLDNTTNLQHVGQVQDIRQTDMLPTTQVLDYSLTNQNLQKTLQARLKDQDDHSTNRTLEGYAVATEVSASNGM